MEATMSYRRKRDPPPRLEDLCVKVAIDNLRYLGDVGETALHLLDRILPHCTLDQLMHVEKCTERDLTQITDKLWQRFYEKQFGEKNTNIVIERMRRTKVLFTWRELYEAKLKDIAEAEKKAAARLRQLYKKEDDMSHPLLAHIFALLPMTARSKSLIDLGKLSRQVRLCTKVPPSSNKRSFWGGNGYNLSNVKSNLMKKAKLDFLKSREVKNIAALKKNAVQRSNSASSSMKPPGGFPGNTCASSSKPANSLGRRS